MLTVKLKCAFKAWRMLFIELELGQKMNDERLKKRVISALTSKRVKNQRKQMLTYACINHIERFKLTRVVHALRTQILKQQTYRHFQISIYHRMDLLR
jgi:hypothetical protein